mmetsp:Transcript_23062/g.56876  ORF Transcript_23062/g.56876 Transcript_23062/m.56876 type:complete len:80 (-) Transcript_23062:2174-2413(-)
MKITLTLSISARVFEVMAQQASGEHCSGKSSLANHSPKRASSYHVFKHRLQKESNQNGFSPPQLQHLSNLYASTGIQKD